MNNFIELSFDFESSKVCTFDARVICSGDCSFCDCELYGFERGVNEF